MNVFIFLGLIIFILLGYLNTLRLRGWSISPIFKPEDDLVVSITDRVYISKELQRLITLTQYYIDSIVSKYSQRLALLTILLFIAIAFVGLPVAKLFFKVSDFSEESPILLILLFIFVLLGAYLVMVLLFSYSVSEYFSWNRQRRYNRVIRLFKELFLLEESTQKIVSISKENFGINEYISVLEKIADQVINIEKFHGALMLIIRPSWLERECAIFTNSADLITAFRVWALTLQKTVGVAIRDNLALMRAEIQEQQSRVRQLSTNSLEFAGVTELQAKRLDDLEKRLII